MEATRRIKSCRSWRQLLELYRTEGQWYNHIHVSATIVALRRCVCACRVCSMFASGVGEREQRRDIDGRQSGDWVGSHIPFPTLLSCLWHISSLRALFSIPATMTPPPDPPPSRLVPSTVMSYTEDDSSSGRGMGWGSGDGGSSRRLGRERREVVAFATAVGA